MRTKPPGKIIIEEDVEASPIVVSLKHHLPDAAFEVVERLPESRVPEPDVLEVVSFRGRFLILDKCIDMSSSSSTVLQTIFSNVNEIRVRISSLALQSRIIPKRIIRAPDDGWLEAPQHRQTETPCHRFPRTVCG